MINLYIYLLAEEGSRQSPVDVIEQEVEQDSALCPISCNYGDGEYCKMENTGASWRLDLWPEETWLRGGPLHGEYQGFQVNFPSCKLDLGIYIVHCTLYTVHCTVPINKYRNGWTKLDN